MTTIRNVCPQCGEALAPRAPEGLCSACLFASLMAEELDEAGQRFGDFEIIETIARGGMGVVYRARQTSLKRVVALKLITASDAAAPDFVERFRNEAEAAASLDHPNIVSVHDFGVHEDQYFLAMRFVAGGTLGRGAAGEKRAAFPPEEAARLTGIVARAVHHAHQRGVLHRDIKPGNILLDEAGEPHLTDFGLAKLIEQDSAITRTAAVLGTPSYMSPEQAAGKVREITTAADTYGLGAVLYYLLTGAPPFAGGTTLETIRLVMEQEPARPSLMNPAVDRDLETICLKCLQKEPARRYGSAEALADDLERWRRQEPILARPVSKFERLGKWVRRHRMRAALLAMAGFAVLAVAVVSAWMNVRLSAARRTIAVQAETRRLELVALYVSTGNRLAEEGDPFAALESFAEAAHLDAVDPERLSMHRYRFAVTKANAPQLEQMLAHRGSVTGASFSADGQRIVTASMDGTARVWDAGTGAAATPPLAASAPVCWTGFSPDGKYVATRTVSGAVRLWRAETGAPAGGPWAGQAVLPARDGGVGVLAFSMDGRWIAVPGAREAVLHAVTGGTGEPRAFSTTQRVNHAFFSPDDTRLALLTEGGGAQVREIADGAQVCSIEPGRVFRNGAWSPDGTMLALADDHFRVRIYDARTGEPRSPFLTHFAMAAGCRFRADGRAVLTWSFDNVARLFDTADGRLLMPPLRHRGPVRAAAFSPDGRRLVTTSADGNARIWDSATGELLIARLPHGGPVLDAAFSPDGERLVTAGADHAARVWKIPAAGFARWVWPHGAPVDEVVFSPDGRHVAVTCVSQVATVWNAATGLRAGEPLKHPRTGVKAGWLDQRRLATSCDDGQFRIWDTMSGQMLSAVEMPAKVHGRFYGPSFVALGPNRVPDLWDASTGRRIGMLDTPPNSQIAGTADGRLLAAMRDREVRVLDAKTGALVRPPFTLEGPLVCPAVSTDVRRIAIGSFDFSFSIWDAVAGRRVAGPLRHMAGVRAAAFTPDNRVLATSAEDKTLRLWDAATGEPLGAPMLHGSYVLHISVRGDSRAFVTSCSDGHARLWEIPPAPETPAEMARMARRLNGRGE